MLPIVRLLRPHQWTKNLLVWAPFLFVSGWEMPGYSQLVWLAFAAFCCLSSATYAFNDVMDAERDRNHPRKSQRPVASGAISKTLAVTLAFLLLMAGLAIAVSINMQALGVLGAYAALQIAYSFWLKHEPVLDVFAIAGGFVLRALMGAVAIQVVASGWLFACTGLFALFLGFAKRRGELLTLGTEGRESLSKYNAKFLDHALTITSASTLVCYALYAISSATAREHRSLAITIPIVAFALLRYLLLAFTQDEGSDPDVLLFKDPQLAISLVLFVGAATWAMLR
ncbi:MAG: UbiA prenyltransferase family protein [Chthonomonas sp.]|nr:UbiA prenyltransferase family protein [Chthonomonas sp.]